MKETSQDCEDGVASKRPRIDAPPLKEEEGDDENKSDVLLIRNLVRPFTLKQLKELLERTGTLEDFWINKIKSHCLVRFSSASEAGETRRALDDVKWPSSNPKRLSVTFSSREKMEETVKESSSFQAPKR
ncbi:Uncharacterized protein FKW44_005959 [Caligus rogercresseyi]|uniref:RRM domain-containing protein n=1 Tax=Caligus rogercresseyi TaxID=217165 RepID=A0A7T8KCN3_CALRO|nr:Uncharacterized protein FKW44_005959 [Caligus rogercresseyi]